MLSAGISYPYELDRERDSERLASFWSKVISKNPLETYFQRFALLEALMKNKRSTVGAQPHSLPIGDGVSPNFRRGDPTNLYAVVGASGTNSVVMATYDMVDMYDQLVISGREERELAEPKMIDRMKWKYDQIINTNLYSKTADLFAAAQVSNKITALPIAILDSGSLAGVADTDVAGWVSNVQSHAGADFEDGGYDRMIDLYNDIIDDKGRPSIICTTKTLFRKLELQYDSDIRYAKTGELARGAMGIKFKETPVIFDSACTAQAMYFIDTDSCFILVNSQADMKFEDKLHKREDQDARCDFFLDEFQLIIEDRRAQGKMILAV